MVYQIRRAWVPWLLLLASIGAGLAFVRGAGIGSSGRAAWLAVILLTCPLFFSGMVFTVCGAASDFT